MSRLYPPSCPSTVVPSGGDRQKIGFFRAGKFSHVNRHLIEMLRADFPQFQLVDIDIQKIVSRRDLAILLSVALEYGSEYLSGRRSYRVRDLLVRNRRYFLRVRDQVRRRTEFESFAFTFQTQSLWDASTPGVPHFVYTDHTHLANLRYPEFDRRALYSEAWIDLEREIYQNAELVFLTSNFSRNSVVEDYDCDEESVKCVYSGVNCDVDAAGAPRSYEQKNILFMGVDWVRKGGPELCEAFELVREVHPDASLTIVGCRPPVEIPNCEVIGVVPREQVGEFYRRASVFCLPSRLEPSAAVFAEAAAYGLPVVATDIGGTSDRVLHGRTGLLVESCDVQQLRDALIDLLDDVEKRRALGMAGRAHSLEQQSTHVSHAARLLKHIAVAGAEREQGLVNPRGIDEIKTGASKRGRLWLAKKHVARNVAQPRHLVQLI